MPPKERHEYELWIEREDGRELVRNRGNIIVDDMVPDDVDMLAWTKMPFDMTFTTAFRISKNMMLLISGNKNLIPNNWLKIHGLPMKRRTSHVRI